MTLTVDATGTGPFSYQWYQGASGDTSNPVNGATSASFTTPALTSTTSYWVRISNGTGPVNSNTATLIVADGLTGSLQVTLSPPGAISAGAQWQLDGGAFKNSDASAVGLSPGTHTLTFKTISGWTTPGSQTVTIVKDQTTIASGTYTIAPNINLSPYKPAPWSDKIVVSRVSNATFNHATDSTTLSSSDALYVSWGQRNEGAIATSVQFNTELFVDGVSRQSWSTQTALAANDWNYVSNYSIGSLSAGIHTIKIVVDSTNAIAETDETDNEYTKTITILPPPPHQPDLLIGNGIADLIGDGIYDGFGVGQALNSSLARGATKTYLVQIQNDGPEVNTFKVRAYGEKPGFVVKFFDGGTNVSPLMKHDGYVMSDFTPGESRNLTVRVTASSTATVGALFKYWLEADYVGNNTIRDTVKLKVRAK